MIRMIFIAVYFFCHSMAFASDKYEEVVIPSNSSMAYQGQSDNANLFSGSVKLKGLLRAYWSGEYGDELLVLDFIPESSKDLPYISDIYNSEQKIIYVNEYVFNVNKKDKLVEYSEKVNHDLVNKYFKNIPASFWRYREGLVEVPATLILKDYVFMIECDRRSYYASIDDIKVEEKTTARLQSLPSCDRALDVTFFVSSKDGYANLREAPSIQSRVKNKLINNQTIKKIKTKNDNWFLVRTENGIEGYIHKSQVQLAN